MNENPRQQTPGQGDAQIDDNQDEFGRDINNPDNRIGDKATVDKTKEERAHEASRKIGLQRERKRDETDPSANVSGGFNQKH